MRQNYSGKKIGILGGSFDPIHQGHLNIAACAREEFHLNEVWFIPAGHSPNKRESEMTAADIRTEMVALAIADIPYFKLSRIEVDAAETSYTYRTLIQLTQMYPDTMFYFIMGADSLDYFEQWCHPEIICQKAVILTAVRDDMDITEIQAKITVLQSLFQAEIYPIQGGRTAVSSTAVRRQLMESQTRPPMLPAVVWQYIRKQGLYKCEN